MKEVKMMEMFIGTFWFIIMLLQFKTGFVKGFNSEVMMKIVASFLISMLSFILTIKASKSE